MFASIGFKALLFQVKIAQHYGCSPIYWDPILNKMVKNPLFEPVGCSTTAFRIWLAFTIIANILSIFELFFSIFYSGSQGLHIHSVSIERNIFSFLRYFYMNHLTSPKL